MWEHLKDLSVIVAAITVYLSFSQWRRDFVGKRKIELAEEVLAMFYEAKDIISEMRQPWGMSGEGQTRQRSENESGEESNILDQAYVIFERYNPHKEKFATIRSKRYQFMARFGRDRGQPFVDLVGILNEVLSSGYRLARIWRAEQRTFRTEKKYEEHLKRLHAAEALFWEGIADPDPITPRLDKVIRDIETICRNIIDPPPSVPSQRWASGKTIMLRRLEPMLIKTKALAA